MECGAIRHSDVMNRIMWWAAKAENEAEANAVTLASLLGQGG
jgi:hypothetical protein